MTERTARRQLPELPLDDWRDSKVHLHLLAQMVGKIRMALHPELNHWWHVPLYVSTRGLTTSGIPTEEGSVEIELDLLDHRIVLSDDRGGRATIDLRDGLTVADAFRDLMAALASFGVRARIVPRPFDPARVGSDVPFADDHLPRRYDPDSVQRFWRILLWTHRVFLTFAGRFTGKSTPVHFFWHSFDLAYTRFSGRRAPLAPTADAVTREAYSHELVSFGFWAGDADIPAPAYYSYTSPEPAGLARANLAPEAAYWNEAGGGAMALYMYDDLRTGADPESSLLRFLDSSYRAGASRLEWDVAALERAAGP